MVVEANRMKITAGMLKLDQDQEEVREATANETVDIEAYPETITI